jgi:hypothetical protein
MALFKVAADKRHLLNAQGQPVFLLGVNYAGYFDRAWKMWETSLFDPTLIARDFRKAQDSGFDSLRLFVHAALDADIRQNKFDKLDQVLSLAQDYNLRVMLTFNDAHSVNLPRVAETDAKIVARYQDVATIFAYDLQNEPVFYNLVAATYPAAYPAPVHTRQLIDTYGERVTRAEIPSLQSQRRIPTFLTADIAYYYINALRLFLEYDAAITKFVRAGKGTLVDFMLSTDAEPWHTFIEVMDKTVEAWLHARLDPLRAAGCRHLVTVGWSWLQFAALPANRLLDFQQYHNYVDLSLAGFETNTSHLKARRQAFPAHPILFGEFGWSNHSSDNPATSQPVSATLTGLYEAATHAWLRANDFGGACKWMLNDVDVTNNPKEANFGVYRLGDQPKPIHNITQRFRRDWPDVTQHTTFTAVRDSQAGLAYRFDAPQQVTIGGHFYQDNALSFTADGEAAHCFIASTGAELRIDALGTGRLTLAPWELLPAWDKSRAADVYRLYADNSRTRQQTIEAGQVVNLDLAANAQYAVAMGAAAPVTPSPTLPQPGPGEHVVLIGDAEDYLPAALGYIRRFGPDFSFVPADVAGRWAYVTVVATPAQISEAALDNMRAMGASLVERVVGDTPAATKILLDGLTAAGQRFRGTVTPPQTEPPAEPEPVTPTPPEEFYVVQPGDTLGGIAKKVYADFRLWTLIFEAKPGQNFQPQPDSGGHGVAHSAQTGLMALKNNPHPNPSPNGERGVASATG